VLPFGGSDLWLAVEQGLHAIEHVLRDQRLV
jgi:hypothetical protein